MTAFIVAYIISTIVCAGMLWHWYNEAGKR